jgi:DnaJ-class molecular chaperone
VSVAGNEVMRGLSPAPMDVSGAVPASRAVNQVVCGSCRGSGQWEEFLPEEVDCMNCDGKGVLAQRVGSPALDSDAGSDEFEIADMAAFADGGWLDDISMEIEQ